MTTCNGLLERLGASMRQWVANRGTAREDDRVWAVALQDARIMAELSRAMSAEAARAAAASVPRQHKTPAQALAFLRLRAVAPNQA